MTGDVTAWVARARQGDAEAFRELFRLHVQRVHRIVYRHGGRRSPTSTIWCRRCSSRRSARCRPFAARRCSRRGSARIAVRVTHARRPAAAPARRPARRRAARARRDRRSRAQPASRARGSRAWIALLATLRPKRRAAFVLHVLEGYSMEEIGGDRERVVGGRQGAHPRRAPRDRAPRCAKIPSFAERVGREGGAVTCREAGTLLADLSRRAARRGGAGPRARSPRGVRPRAGARAELWARLLPTLRAAAPPAPDAMRARRMEVAIERRLARRCRRRRRPRRRSVRARRDGGARGGRRRAARGAPHARPGFVARRGAPRARGDRGRRGRVGADLRADGRAARRAAAASRSRPRGEADAHARSGHRRSRCTDRRG